MNYFCKRALFYISFFTELSERDSSLMLDRQKIFDTVFDMLLITKKERQSLELLLLNEELGYMFNTNIIDTHLEMLKSVCKNEGLFGDKPQEKEAIIAKGMALKTIEDLAGAHWDLSIALDSTKEINSTNATLLFLLEQISTGEVSRENLSLLRKTAAKKTMSEIDPIIFLLSSDKENNQQYLNSLKEKISYKARSHELQRITKTYEATAERGEYNGSNA